MQELFDAVNFTLVTTNVGTGLLSLIAIGGLFMGFGYVRKIMARAK